MHMYCIVIGNNITADHTHTQTSTPTWKFYTYTHKAEIKQLEIYKHTKMHVNNIVNEQTKFK